MGKYRTKTIQADLGIFSKYSDINRHMQAYSEACRTKAFPNPGIFRTLVYSEPGYGQKPWFIQNLGTFRILLYSEPEAYSEPWEIPMMEHIVKIVNG